MPVIDLGINFETAAVEAEKFRNPAPDGIYQLQCKSCGVHISDKGNQSLEWIFSIVNCPDQAINGKRVRKYTALPSGGSLSGIGFLVDITRALGRPWSGAQLTTEEYIGLTCTANLSKTDDGKWNEVDSFV